jgi:hypothetical protein
MNDTSQPLLESALKLIDAAEERDLHLRLLGGAAFAWHRHARSDGAWEQRAIADIDLCGYATDYGRIESFLDMQGFTMNREFNFLNAPYRLMSACESLRVDVFLDELRMCQVLDLRGRITRGRPTLPVTDLLLTKLQIVQLADKDVWDVLGLLREHPVVADSDSAEDISTTYMNEICSTSWRWYHTAMRNLGYLRHLVDECISKQGESQVTEGQIDKITVALAQSRKSLGWRLRSIIGERMQWYDAPEAEA